MKTFYLISLICFTSCVNDEPKEICPGEIQVKSDTYFELFHGAIPVM